MGPCFRSDDGERGGRVPDYHLPHHATVILHGWAANKTAQPRSSPERELFEILLFYLIEFIGEIYRI
jgi:hypothetical protein